MATVVDPAIVDYLTWAADRQADKPTGRQADRQTGRQTNRQVGGQAQAGRRTDTQVDR